MKKIFIVGAVALASMFSGSMSFANDDVYTTGLTLTVENTVNVEDTGVVDLVVGYTNIVASVVVDFLVPWAGASFMGDIATDIWSGATAEVTQVIGGPIGSIIFYILAIALIWFVVSTITMWVRRGKNSN